MSRPVIVAPPPPDGVGVAAFDHYPGGPIAIMAKARNVLAGTDTFSADEIQQLLAGVVLYGQWRT